MKVVSSLDLSRGKGQVSSKSIPCKAYMGSAVVLMDTRARFVMGSGSFERKDGLFGYA